MQQSLRNGTELGAYTIVRLIGRGGMGEVYEAYEHRLQRKVALKVIAPQKAGVHGEVDLVRRFLQEARTLAQVNHPNVVTIYAIDRIDETQFIAMEFVDGASFKDLFTLFALSADEASPIFLQLLEGLGSLHDNKILHRDIKPHNLMIRPNGQVKILDFGIAKRLNDRERENTTVGVVVGTLAYLPPEVLYGSAANIRSDLWSLGAIFYECMVGQPLVSMHSMKVKGVKAATASDVIFPQESLGWIPQEMRSIVAKLCDRQPENRYVSAAEAIDAVKRYQNNRPPMAPGAAHALQRAVGNLDEIQESCDLKKLDGPKAKRTLTLSVLSGMPDSESEQPLPVEVIEESVASEVIKDSVSARRKAQKNSRQQSKRQWKIPAALAASVLVAAVVAPKLYNSKSKEPVKKPDIVAVAETLKLVSPTDNQALWLEPSQLPTLYWSRAVGPGEYELQIASDGNFNNIAVREEVTGTSYRPSKILGESEYHWQLWPSHGVVKPIGPGHFSISVLSPLELAWPKPDQTFAIARGIKSHNVSFKWKCKPGARTYGAQVSSDPGFTTVVNDTLISACAWNDIALPSGTYYWRVRVEEPAVAQSTTSAKQSFVIKGEPVTQQIQAQPLTQIQPQPQIQPHPQPQVIQVATKTKPMSAPHLKNPKLALTLKFATAGPIRDVASARKQISVVPVFHWQPVKGAKSYEVQISWTHDFSRLLAEENVNSAYYEWTQVVPGKLYWRVRGLNENLAPSPFSTAGSVDVRLPAPVISAIYTFTDDTPLEWPPVPLAEKYVVEWSASRSMASAKEKTTLEPKIPLDVSKEPIYVRVAAASSDGARVSGFSQVATITTEAPIKMMAPGIITPPKGAKVVVGKSGRISIVFSWGKVENATNYNVEIASNSDFSKVIQKRTVPSTHWLLKGAKFNGKVYWRVRTEGPGGPSPWSNSGYFEVR